VFLQRLAQRLAKDRFFTAIETASPIAYNNITTSATTTSAATTTQTCSAAITQPSKI
jgi:hypothetical protein